MSEHEHSGMDQGLRIRLGQEPREPRQFIKYTFFTLDPAWRRLPPDEREQGKDELARIIEEQAPEFFVLQSYNLLALHHDTDFMLWSVSATLEQQSALLTSIYSTALGAWLRVSYSYLAMTKHSQYVRDHVHDGQDGTSLATVIHAGRSISSYIPWTSSAIGIPYHLKNGIRLCANISRSGTATRL